MPPHGRNPYLRLPLPPKGMLYGIDTDYLRPMPEWWAPMRPGSNFEIPEIRPNARIVLFPWATGKSKKLYERALAKAFLAARISGAWKKAGEVGIALHHWARLKRRCA